MCILCSQPEHELHESRGQGHSEDVAWISCNSHNLVSLIVAGLEHVQGESWLWAKIESWVKFGWNGQRNTINSGVSLLAQEGWTPGDTPELNLFLCMSIFTPGLAQWNLLAQHIYGNINVQLQRQKRETHQDCSVVFFFLWQQQR